jgi:hypothetical protein
LSGRTITPFAVLAGSVKNEGILKVRFTVVFQEFDPRMFAITPEKAPGLAG